MVIFQKQVSIQNWALVSYSRWKSISLEKIHFLSQTKISHFGAHFSPNYEGLLDLCQKLKENIYIHRLVTLSKNSRIAQRYVNFWALIDWSLINQLSDGQISCCYMELGTTISWSIWSALSINLSIRFPWFLQVVNHLTSGMIVHLWETTEFYI